MSLSRDLDNFCEESLREAQYGGRGGQPPSWAPGGLPFNSRGKNGDGGINHLAPDSSFESIISGAQGRTMYQDNTSNLETRIQMFHAAAEDDIVAYMNSEARTTWKRKQAIRRREYLKEQERSQPVVEVVQAEPVLTMEQCLIDRHTMDDALYSDVPAEPARPERYHYAKNNSVREQQRDNDFWIGGMNTDSSTAKVTPTSTAFDNLTDENMGPFDPGRARMHMAPMGHDVLIGDPMMDHPIGDQYMDGIAALKEEWKGQGYGDTFHTRTLAFDPENIDPSQAHMADGESPVPMAEEDAQPTPVQSPSGAQTMEQALNKDRAKTEKERPGIKRKRNLSPTQMDLTRVQNQNDYKSAPEGFVRWFGINDDPRYQGGDLLGLAPMGW